MAFQTFFTDHHHFAGRHFADEFGTNYIQCTGFRTQRPTIPQAAQNKGAHSHGVTHTDQFLVGHGNDGKRSFNAAQGVLHPFRDVLLKRARHQVDDTFRVRGALKNGSSFNQFTSERLSVRNIPVMCNRGTTHREFAKKWLNIANGCMF